MWDGQERRKGYIQMDKDFQDLKLGVAIFTATVTEWMKSTKEYRVALCEKVDNLDRKIDCLPNSLPGNDNDIRLRKCETEVANIKGKASLFGAICGFLGGILTKKW